MNVFASSSCPVRCARVLDDRRVVKMILESCQVLSTAAAIYGRWQPGFARPTHALHPCVLWVAEGRQNFEWLWEHANALDSERRWRWSRDTEHKTLAACRSAKIAQTQRYLPSGRTPFVNCARNRQLGIDFTSEPNVHRAYRLYLKARWATDNKPPFATCPFGKP